MAKHSFNDTACSLLGFLIDRPMSGWDLAELVTETVGNFWHVTRSQIYRELRTLEKHGLVTGGEKGVRDRRTYTITRVGLGVFEDWIEQEPGDYIGRVPLLMTVWFSDHVPEEDFSWYLRLHRSKHKKKADAYRKILQGLPEKSAPIARALRFGLMFEQLFVSWIDTLPQFGGRDEIVWPGQAADDRDDGSSEEELRSTPGKLGEPDLG